MKWEGEEAMGSIRPKEIFIHDVYDLNCMIDVVAPRVSHWRVMSSHIWSSPGVIAQSSLCKASGWVWTLIN